MPRVECLRHPSLDCRRALDTAHVVRPGFRVTTVVMLLFTAHSLLRSWCRHCLSDSTMHDVDLLIIMSHQLDIFVWTSRITEMSNPPSIFVVTKSVLSLLRASLTDWFRNRISDDCIRSLYLHVCTLQQMPCTKTSYAMSPFGRLRHTLTSCGVAVLVRVRVCARTCRTMFSKTRASCQSHSGCVSREDQAAL